MLLQSQTLATSSISLTSLDKIFHHNERPHILAKTTMHIELFMKPHPTLKDVFICTFEFENQLYPIHSYKKNSNHWFLVDQIAHATGLLDENAINEFTIKCEAVIDTPSQKHHPNSLKTKEFTNTRIFDEKNACIFIEELVFEHDNYRLGFYDFFQKNIQIPLHENDVISFKRKNLKLHGKEAIQQRTFMAQTGDFVAIRPCAKQYGNKTYLGLMVGDVAQSFSAVLKTSAEGETEYHIQPCGYNPCILIPDLGKLVYGCESWWGAIKNEQDLRQITDIDINNQWYVRALKQLSKKSNPT